MVGARAAFVKPIRLPRTATDMTWQTPQWLLERERIYQGGRIEFDPATTPENPTGARMFCAGEGGPLFVAAATAKHLEDCDLCCDRQCMGWLALQSGLDVGWYGLSVWCNPPYGRALKLWLKKFVLEARRPGANAANVRALIPCSRFEQPYMQAALAAANAVCWIDAAKLGGKGARRVAFVSTVDGAEPGANPSASMILAFNVDLERFRRAYGPVGTCQELRPILEPAAPAIVPEEVRDAR